MALYTKQWIKENVVNFICESKSVSKQDVLIMVTWPSKVVQWTETMLSKFATFHYIHWVDQTPKCLKTFWLIFELILFLS